MRKSSVLQPGTAPKTFTNVVRWFQENEAPRGVGKEKDGSISVWFHGKGKKLIVLSVFDPLPLFLIITYSHTAYYSMFSKGPRIVSYPDPFILHAV